MSTESRLLAWINDDLLLEATRTQLIIYNRSRQICYRLSEGAKLIAVGPNGHFIRYLTPIHDGEELHFSFRDWFWATGTTQDLNTGTIYTYCCAFAPNGHFAQGGDWEDGGYWGGIDPAGHPLAGSIRLPQPFDMVFSPDGSRLLTGGRRSSCAIWAFSANTYPPLLTLPTPSVVTAVDWSYSGNYIAALNMRNEVLVFQAQTGELVTEIPAPFCQAQYFYKHKLRFWPKKEHFICICSGDNIQVIDWRKKETLIAIPAAETFDISPSGENIAFWREGEKTPVILSGPV